jgi:hypothetical protein
MPRSCDAITIAVDDLIKLACTDHQGRVQVERYLLLFEQAPKEISRLSTELSDIYAKHQRKFGHAILTLRRRIKANSCHTMNSFNGTPSANAGSFPSFGSATPNHQPRPSATNTTDTSQPQPFNTNVANGMAPFNMNAANGQKKWEGAVPKIQILLKELLEEFDAEQRQRDAQISHRNGVIQQLNADNLNTEKASEKAKIMKDHLIQIQNDLASGLRGMEEVQIEAAKQRPFFDSDL